MTTTTQHQELTALAAELTTVQASINDLTERETAIKARIRELTPTPGTYAAGDVAITIAVNRRFDPVMFAEHFPVSANPEFYKLVPDATLVKRGLSPEAYESFMAVVGDAKVSIR